MGPDQRPLRADLFLKSKMINQTIDKINKRDEEYRRKFALYASLFVFVAVFGVWSLQRGILDLNSGRPDISKKENSGQLASVEAAPSPLDSSKEVAGSVWSELNKSYNELKESLSNVFVPFVTGIEVYERK